MPPEMKVEDIYMHRLEVNRTGRYGVRIVHSAQDTHYKSLTSGESKPGCRVATLLNGARSTAGARK